MTEKQGGRLGIFVRVTRAQFVPVTLAPLAIGIASAWYLRGYLNPLFVLLVIVGSISLHLAANSIDDVYDFINGVDTLADRMFPRDFPGWKPITRGLISVNEGYAISAALYAFSLAVGIYLSLVVGWLALIIAVPGIVLSYFYVAPPLRLDYRGFGLGELSIFLSFGPIPALGAFYVLTGSLSVLPILAAIPAGLLTVGVLLYHDMIFYDAYKAAGKRSLTVLLGQVSSGRLSMVLGSIAYATVALLTALRILPSSSLLAYFALPLFLRKTDFGNKILAPPQYASRTLRAFVHSVLFSLLLSLGLLI